MRRHALELFEHRSPFVFFILSHQRLSEQISSGVIVRI